MPKGIREDICTVRKASGLSCVGCKYFQQCKKTTQKEEEVKTDAAVAETESGGDEVIEPPNGINSVCSVRKVCGLGCRTCVHRWYCEVTGRDGFVL